LQTVNTVRKF